MNPVKVIFAYFILIFCMYACDTDDLSSQDDPQIIEVTPMQLYPSTQLTIIGKGFGILGNDDQVFISNRRLNVLAWTATEITVLIPSDILIGHSILVLVIEGSPLPSIPIEIFMQKESL